MDRNTIRKEITALISSIKSQSDLLADEKYPSQLELELFLHKIEKLYQKSIVFNHLSLFDGFEESEAMVQQRSAPAADPLPEKKAVPQAIQPPPVSQTTALARPVESQPLSSIPPVEKPIESQPEKKEEPASLYKTRPLSLPDLKSSIGINDKFQFTNELFKGNMQEFNIAIEQLNASETHESALAYITGLKQLYKWDDENDTVKRWLTIIERRYS